MARLTKKQLEVLAGLPVAADTETGRYCKGANFRAADALERKGLAAMVRRGAWVGGYFVRTADGAAALLETRTP